MERGKEMRSTDILSRIGQDIGRLLFNNATTLEILTNADIKAKNDHTNQSEIMLREDLNDLVTTNRDLVALLHLAIKDFPVNQMELADVSTLMEPDELSNLPEPLSDQFPDPKEADEYFSEKAKEREDLLDKFPFLRDRMKGNLNGE